MKSAIHILKAHEVEVSGFYSMATGKASCPAAPDAPGVEGAPQAKIIEQHPQYAILEVTCACGQSLQVKCDYSQAMATS